MRGGSWNNNDNNTRSSNRNRNNPTNSNNNVGFRLLKTFHARVFCRDTKKRAFKVHYLLGFAVNRDGDIGF